MIKPVILERLEALPESLQTEVLHYIEFLAERYASGELGDVKDKTKKRRLFGSMKGTFVLPLPDNFDEPLDDFEEYM